MQIHVVNKIIFLPLSKCLKLIKSLLDTQLLRRLPAAYSDGVYLPSGKDRPEPIEVSLGIMAGVTGKPSYRNKTAFLVFFG